MRPQLTRINPQKIDPSRIRKILLIRLRRIGDVVMTTPAVQVLRHKYPQAHITYAIEEPYQELMEGHPDIDEILVIPSKMGYIDFLSHIKSIRRKKYDALIDLHGGPRAFLLTLFSRAKLKIGHRLKYKHRFYHLTIPRLSEKGMLHSVENHVKLVNALGIDPKTIPSLQLPASKQAHRERANELLTENNLQKQRYVCLHIGAGNEFRDWGRKNLQEFIRLLNQIPDLAVLLIGGTEDHPVANRLLESNTNNVASLVGQLNLLELRELISQASLFIGPDSGPMHIAASTTTPIVAYFGPTLPKQFAPWKAKTILLEKNFDCRPCRQKECIHQDFRCLQTITPEEVYAACLEFLSKEE